MNAFAACRVVLICAVFEGSGKVNNIRLQRCEISSHLGLGLRGDDTKRVKGVGCCVVICMFEEYFLARSHTSTNELAGPSRICHTLIAGNKPYLNTAIFTCSHARASGLSFIPTARFASLSGWMNKRVTDREYWSTFRLFFSITITCWARKASKLRQRMEQVSERVQPVYLGGTTVTGVLV